MPQPLDFVLAAGVFLIAALAIDLILPALFPRVGRWLRFVAWLALVALIGGLWLGIAWWILLLVYAGILLLVRLRGGMR